MVKAGKCVSSKALNNQTCSVSASFSTAFCSSFLPAGKKELQKAVEKLAETEHVWLFNAFEETHFPALTMAEITLGDAAEQWTTEEIVTAMETLLNYAYTSE